MTGAKLSTVNVTTARIRGVQVDAFNYAEEGEFQLCLIDIHGTKNEPRG